ncbi:hypothetical protein BsWGS_27326 [Bradybaena similaris]
MGTQYPSFLYCALIHPYTSHCTQVTMGIHHIINTSLLDNLSSHITGLFIINLTVPQSCIQLHYHTTSSTCHQTSLTVYTLWYPAITHSISLHSAICTHHIA